MKTFISTLKLSILILIISSCSGYRGQVKCPTPDNTGKSYASNRSPGKFRISKKATRFAYRSYYKKNSSLPLPVKERKDSRNDNLELIASVQPGYSGYNIPEIIFSEKPSSSLTEVSVDPAENQRSIISGSKVSEKQFRKEIKAKVRSIKKENRELTKKDSSDKSATGLSIASFVLGVVGLIIFGIPAGILAVVFGGIAMSRYKKHPEEKLKGLAIAGLILGIIDIVGALIVVGSLL